MEVVQIKNLCAQISKRGEGVIVAPRGGNKKNYIPQQGSSSSSENATGGVMVGSSPGLSELRPRVDIPRQTLSASL